MLGFSFTLRPGGAVDAELAAYASMPQTGLISQWRFREGTGTTVADEIGSNDINLDTPTTPNYTWTARGIQLTAGLVQTPSITSVRTVAFLYRVVRGDTNFLLSGGPSGSGSGILGDSVTTAYTHHVGGVRGVTPTKFRASNGTAAYRLNRGAWKVAFCEFSSAGNSVIGFGGRHSTTTSRCADFEIAGAVAYSGQLNDANRLAIYNAYRTIAANRGFYIDWRDCPTTEDMYWLWGESNADGRALISGLSAGEQAKSLSRNYFVRNSGSTLSFGPAPTALTLGNDPNNVNDATIFGPIIAVAWERQDDNTITRNLHCVMSGTGSTYMALGGVGSSTSGTSWNAAELPAAGLFWLSMRAVWDAEDDLLLDGIGPKLAGTVTSIGLNDATNTAHTTDTATYQALLQATHDAIETYLAAPDLPMVMLKTHNSDPGSNATALGHVRAAQVAFAAANSNVELIDTDATGLNVDSVHYSAAGMKTLGPLIYDALPWDA